MATGVVTSRKRSLSASDTGVISSPIRRRATQSTESQGDTFTSVLSKAGCSLRLPGGPAAVACESRTAIDQLEEYLKANTSVVQSFLDSFQHFIAEEDNLRRILLPMERTAGLGNTKPCDTLARVLLSVATIQSSVASMLLQKLPEFFEEDEDDSLGLPPLVESIPRLILSQFRWLEFVIDGTTLATKLLEILTICPLGLRKEIIVFLPEVIVDADHGLVGQTLVKMLHQDLQLIVPIVDAFSSLNLDEDLFQQVVDLAQSSISSADAEDLPLVLKFLLQSATPANVKQIVQQLRDNLQFLAKGDVRTSKEDRKQKGTSPAANYESLILEAIRSGLRFKNVVLDTIMKDIRNAEGETQHRVIDVLFLLIIQLNGGPHRKMAQDLFLSKIIRGEIGRSLLQRCVQGRGDYLQVYFQTLLSIIEMCLRSTDHVAKHFGTYSFELLFEEFTETYYRQEVLGSLITLTGSGISHEVESALDTLLSLATKQADKLLQVSSFLNGILDSLESFADYQLHQVYKIFSHLAVCSWSASGSSAGSSVASELVIVIRKQISSPDLKYKRMGIIGGVGLATCLGREEIQEAEIEKNRERSSTDEAIFLLQSIAEACKSVALSKGFFYDELTSYIETTRLNGQLMNWISKHTSEFESLYLGDLENGQLQTGSLQSSILEGDIWMNLDGDVSPIVVNILPMLSASDKSTSQTLLFLTANFRLLSSVERVINQGSLGSIDALLGCPMFLPKHQLLLGDDWGRLSKLQKETSCLALFYAINWIRELINSFSTQIEGRPDDLITQTTREETITKLCKRVRNLMYLEFCLGECLASTEVSLPCFDVIIQDAILQKTELKQSGETKKPPARRGRKKKVPVPPHGSQRAEELSSRGGRQQTIHDAFRKIDSGVHKSSEVEEERAQHHETSNIDSVKSKGSSNLSSLEEQRWKFRPLSLSTISILTAQVPGDACCPDPVAMLPVYLYLLRDLETKLEVLQRPSRKLAPWLRAPITPRTSSTLTQPSSISVLKKLAGAFPSFRKHLDNSQAVFRSDMERNMEDGGKPCEHWEVESIASQNPVDARFEVQMKDTAEAVFLFIIRCIGKVAGCPDLATPQNHYLLKEFLTALKNSEPIVPHPASSIASGSLEELFLQAYAYLDGLVDPAISMSITAATELIMALKALVGCAQGFIEKSTDKTRHRRPNNLQPAEIVLHLRGRLSLSAGQVLGTSWDSDEWKKPKGDMLKLLVQIQIENNEHPILFLEELACVAMPQVFSRRTKSKLGVDGYPALSPATFLTWYRVVHEEVVGCLSKVMKQLQGMCKLRTAASSDLVIKVLEEVQQCTTVHVALVNLTKSHEKAPVHAMAVKSGGKFIDLFLKGMDFFKMCYDNHKDAINYMMRELQKATRIIHALCSDAKGQKRMPVTCKVPAVKRSLERYVFCVKALLHGTSHGDSFWMGNLKHKDLHGHEISSQVYADANEDNSAEVDDASDSEIEREGGDEDDTLHVID